MGSLNLQPCILLSSILMLSKRVLTEKLWEVVVKSTVQMLWHPSPRMTGLMFQLGANTLNCTLANSTAMFHLPWKAWIAARWAQVALKTLLDYLPVKYSSETVVPSTRSRNNCSGAAYTKTPCQWEHRCLWFSHICCIPGGQASKETSLSMVLSQAQVFLLLQQCRGWENSLPFS